ncbi:MAG: S41 family peptidase [Betaproteobacteria bacterium]
MSPRTRVLVMSISAPIVAFAIVGGFLGKVMAREGSYQDLRMFDEVTGLIDNNYVQNVDIDKVMHGAMHGLADALDADSAYLSPAEVKEVQDARALPPGDVGLELTRQYYLRVIAAREGSPAAHAGLRTGDYIRMIDDQATRDMSVWEGVRALRGAPGSTVKLTVIRGSAADPHVVELTREAMPDPEVTGRIAAPGVGYVRIPEFEQRTAEQVKAEVARLKKEGAAKLLVDIRQASSGVPASGLSVARLFVGTGTLAILESKRGDSVERETIAAAPGDGSITDPVTVLIDTGSSGAAELFASALVGNHRADLVGERTIGRVAVQKLITLPDGSGLWLSTGRYLQPDGSALHEKGLEPTVAVDEPEVEFGQPAPTADPIFEKALASATGKGAA